MEEEVYHWLLALVTKGAINLLVLVQEDRTVLAGLSSWALMAFTCYIRFSPMPNFLWPVPTEHPAHPWGTSVSGGTSWCIRHHLASLQSSGQHLKYTWNVWLKICRTCTWNHLCRWHCAWDPSFSFLCTSVLSLVAIQSGWQHYVLLHFNPLR